MKLNELLDGKTITHTTAMYNDKPRPRSPENHPAYPQSSYNQNSSSHSSSDNGSDQEDKVTMDIPMFIRLLEWAKEDAETDMDLHEVAERVAKHQSECLTMEDYDSIIIPKEQNHT